MNVTTSVKAGGSSYQHNEILVARALKVKTHLKAGFTIKKTSD